MSDIFTTKMLFYILLVALASYSEALLDPVTSDNNPDHAVIMQLITQEQSLRLQLENKINDQQNKISSLISQVNNLSDQIAKDRRQIAFFGTVGSNIPANQSTKIVKFQQITTNIGNAYSSSTGIFHCPVSGIYLVSGTVLSDVGHHISINVYQNSKVIARPYTGSGTLDHMSGSDTAVVHATAGDEIYLKDFTTASTYLDNQTRFVVVLLEAD